MKKKWQISLLIAGICLLGFSSMLFTVQCTTETIEDVDPGKRHGHGMVFIERSTSIMLFGGRKSNDETDTSELNRLWNYNFTSGEWSIIETNNTPSSRFNHAMVYIPSVHSILIYGGFNNTNSVELTDTWILNLTSCDWQKINSSAYPQMKSNCGFLYDSANDRVLLFGGFQGGIRSNQLWKFYVSNNTWEFQSTVNSPTPRYGVGFVFNKITNQSYLFGGREQTISSEFYTLNTELDSWQEIQGEYGPYHRYWHSMVHDNNTNQIILFGGESGIGDRGMLDDTWVYSFGSNSWEEITLRKVPVARIMSPMVFSPSLNKAYVYGGIGSDYEEVFNDFWEFDCFSYKWSEVGKNQIPIPTYTIILSMFVGITCMFFKTKKPMQK